MLAIQPLHAGAPGREAVASLHEVPSKSNGCSGSSCRHYLSPILVRERYLEGGWAVVEGRGGFEVPVRTALA